jgi:small subunit ribosomal protein S20
VANIKSQIKRNKQNEKKRLRNRNFRGAARAAVKVAKANMGETEVKKAVSALDKAAEKGTIHPRNAARRKSRLMKAANKAAKAPAAEKAEKKPAKKTAAKK